MPYARAIEIIRERIDAAKAAIRARAAQGDALDAPVDADVQQDAERYRYLRNGVLVDGEVDEDLYVHVDHQSYPNRWALVGLELDDAIDAAMKKGGA